MTAAALTNILKALSGCLRIFAVYISESRLGPIKVITFSSLSFTLGLTLLYVPTVKYSYPSVIIGLLVLAVGKAGLEALLEQFLIHELELDKPKTKPDESQKQAPKSFWKRVTWNWVWWHFIISSPVAVASLIRFYFDRQLILVIVTSLMGSGCFLFWCGNHLYNPRKSAGVGNGFSVIFRVIKAFVLQIKILGYPISSKHPVNYDNDELSPKINWLRGLDKVANISPSTPSQEEQQEEHQEEQKKSVQLVKRFLSMIPMWTTVLVVGLVLSTCDTFFPEQGTNMKSSGFSVCLFKFQELSQEMGSYLLRSLIHSKCIPKAKRKTAIQVGIWGGIVSSILCSSVAWQVEHHRVTIIGVNDLSDKPDKKIPMSIFWLSPQFIILGLTKGFVAIGLDEFTGDQFQGPWKEYVSQINKFVTGLGNFLSTLFIQANKSLFGDTLNKSRLDKYYHRLTIVSYVNMLYFFFVIYTFYGSKYQNINDEISRGLKPGEARRKFFEEVKGSISSLPPRPGDVPQ